MRATALSREIAVSPVTAILLLRRGISSAPEAERFLRSDLAQLHDPLAMRGMGEAVTLLRESARRGERIVVFGDYDVDGVTAVAQLRAVLRRLGADAVPFIPHRLRDGYGLKPETLRRVIAEHRPHVLMTVDCGITAVEAVCEATAAGVSVVITDHHLPAEELPRGTVVVNPRQAGCHYPYKELSGSGIAFKIAQALIREARITLAEESLLKLAALGTIADLVPLTGENRVIAASGLRALADARAPGLLALLRLCGVVGRSPSAEEVGFRIGPRLNAAGRLDTAELALSLFEERDPARAEEVALELSRRNAERQALQRRAVADVRARLVRAFEPDRDRLILEASPDWHRGVLGIAAATIAREYHRPTLLFAREGDRMSGSGRSISGVSLHALLSELRDEFLEFGGHEQAVGCSLLADRWERFAARARRHFTRGVPETCLGRVLEIDAEIEIGAVSPSLLAEIERLEPFGPGNPRPVFLSHGLRAPSSFWPVGERGRRGTLIADGRPLPVIAWEDGEELDSWASSGVAADLAFHLRRGRLGGGVELEVVGWRPSSRGGV